MTDNKGKFAGIDPNKENEDRPTAGALRARNRTVMLTPDVTGEVRARLAQENKSGQFGLGGGLRVGTSRVVVDEVETNFPEVPERSEGLEEPDNYEQIEADEPEVPHIPNIISRPEPTIINKTPEVNIMNESNTRTDAVPRSRTSTMTLGAQQVSNSNIENSGCEQIVWTKKGPVLGFLISYDENPEGTVFNLYSGRLIITSEAPNSGNYMLLQHESVSPMHAILRLGQSGELQVLDQLSEFGTKIKHNSSDAWEELSGDKGTLEHGDVIMFGERKFHVCLVVAE